jgi:hypothetical protein
VNLSLEEIHYHQSSYQEEPLHRMSLLRHHLRDSLLQRHQPSYFAPANQAAQEEEENQLEKQVRQLQSDLVKHQRETAQALATSQHIRRRHHHLASVLEPSSQEEAHV